MKNKDIKLIKFRIFNNYEFVEHGFSTRLGGISENQYASMNLRFNSNDKRENVEKNLEIFLNEFNLRKENVFFSDQIHKSNVGIIKTINKNLIGVDALVTDKTGIGIITTHADCIPVFFLDPVKKVVSVAHSGWGGTLQNISENVIDVFIKEYGSLIENILVGIGPGIDKCCYEVREDLFEKFLSVNREYKAFFKPIEDKYLLDLKGIIKYNLLKKGIVEDNIEVSTLCTMCNPDMFFSHRRQGLDRGTMLALIKLNSKKNIS